MAWPKNTKASTNNVDAGTDSITSARADIKQNFDNVNDIIDTFDIGGDSAGQIADGDILQYNSTASAFQPIASTSVGGANQLVIPFGGFVVNKWSGDTAYPDSAGYDDRDRFFRIVTLGGAVYERDEDLTGGDLPLTSAQTVYGQITGASITRATPTLNKPTGYSVGGPDNISLTITNGFLSVGSSAPSASRTFSNHSGNINDFTNAVAATIANVQYGTGYDNYITLPAGDYVLSFKTHTTSFTNTYTTHSIYVEEDNDAFDFDPNGADIWLYNKTDGVEISSSLTDNIGLTFDNWTTDTVFPFTLAGTKDIQIFNSANQTANNFGADATDVQSARDFLGFQILAGSPALSGDITGGNGTTASWNYKDTGTNLGIPAKLGWYSPINNVYIVITKIA